MANDDSMQILRIIAYYYLSMQELLLLIMSFPFNPSMRNRLHTVKQILEADMYEIVDFKVKIITKFQSKQSVMKNQVSMQKIDTLHTIVANDTGTIKLILWEQLIDCPFSTVLSLQQSYYYFVSLTMTNLSTLMS